MGPTFFFDPPPHFSPLHVFPAPWPVILPPVVSRVLLTPLGETLSLVFDPPYSFHDPPTCPRRVRNIVFQPPSQFLGPHGMPFRLPIGFHWAACCLWGVAVSSSDAGRHWIVAFLQVRSARLFGKLAVWILVWRHGV